MDDEQLHVIVALKHCGRHTWREIGSALGWTRTKARAKYLRRDKKKYPPETMPIPCPICNPEQQPSAQYEEDGNYAKLTILGDRVRSIDELLDTYNIDRDVWQVLRPKLGYYEGFAKNEWQDLRWVDGSIVEGFSKKKGVVVTPLYRMEVTLVRREPIAIHPVIRPVECPVTFTKYPRPLSGLRRALIGADSQIGYRHEAPNKRLEPFHDRLALDLFLQLAKLLQPELIVLLGDILDLTEWTDKFVRSPEFHGMTQPAIQEAFWWLRQLREACPKSRIEVHEGNHEKRMRDYLSTHCMAAYGLKPADEIDLPPALSPPRLLGLDKLGIEWVGEYPDDLSRINASLQCYHGERASAVPGGTARAVLSDFPTISTLFAHAHRREKASQTNWCGASIENTVEAHGIGCLCNKKTPAKSQRNNWQESVAIVDYDETEYSIYDLEIREGKLVWNQQMLEGRDRVDDLRKDLPTYPW